MGLVPRAGTLPLAVVLSPRTSYMRENMVQSFEIELTAADIVTLTDLIYEQVPRPWIDGAWCWEPAALGGVDIEEPFTPLEPLMAANACLAPVNTCQGAGVPPNIQ